MRHRAFWAGLTALSISACGPPPQTIQTLPPGFDRSSLYKPEPDEEAHAKGEGMTERLGKASAPAPKEPDTPPPVRPIAGRTVTRRSGLKVEVLQEGAGAVAARGLVVDAHITGWVDGGKKFESSREQAGPFQFTLGARDVLPGWDEGVEGMKVGERRRLTVPPDLGYGERGNANRKIPSNATLIYDVELVGVVSPNEIAKRSPKEPESPPPVRPIAERALPSGLKVATLQEGTGAVARAGQAVDVHYTGWLLDGPKFDSSRERDAPYRFVLGTRAVIAGWDLGVEGMKVGERRRLTVPPDLGYGAAGSGQKIPGHSTLIFDIELVAVADPTTAPAPTSPATAAPGDAELPDPFSAPGAVPKGS